MTPFNDQALNVGEQVQILLLPQQRWNPASLELNSKQVEFVAGKEAAYIY